MGNLRLLNHFCYHLPPASEPTPGVGLTICRVNKIIPSLVRCFRCLVFGHLRRDCGGPRLERGCYRCESQNHRRKGCTRMSDCVACHREGTPPPYKHFPGSRACSTRLAAGSIFMVQWVKRARGRHSRSPIPGREYFIGWRFQR